MNDYTVYDAHEYPSDADFRAFLARVDPVAARLDRIAHASAEEMKWLRRGWQA